MGWRSKVLVQRSQCLVLAMAKIAFVLVAVVSGAGCGIVAIVFVTPGEHFVGDDTSPILLAHKLVDCFAVEVRRFLAGSCFEMVGYATCCCVWFLAERAGETSTSVSGAMEMLKPRSISAVYVSEVQVFLPGGGCCHFRSLVGSQSSSEYANDLGCSCDILQMRTSQTSTNMPRKTMASDPNGPKRSCAVRKRLRSQTLWCRSRTPTPCCSLRWILKVSGRPESVMMRSKKWLGLWENVECLRCTLSCPNRDRSFSYLYLKV